MNIFLSTMLGSGLRNEDSPSFKDKCRIWHFGMVFLHFKKDSEKPKVLLKFEQCLWHSTVHVWCFSKLLEVSIKSLNNLASQLSTGGRLCYSLYAFFSLFWIFGATLWFVILIFCSSPVVFIGFKLSGSIRINSIQFDSIPGSLGAYLLIQSTRPIRTHLRYEHLFTRWKRCTKYSIN